MSLLLKIIFLSAILIAASESDNEEKALEEHPFVGTDSGLKGYAVAFNNDDHGFDVDDLQSDEFVQPYANETASIVEHGRFTGNWYRSKRMRKPDDGEDISVSEYYRNRRRPDYKDEDRSEIYNYERRRHSSDDEDRRRSNDNERSGRPDADEDWRRNEKERRGRTDSCEEKRGLYYSERRNRRNCQTCGRMMGGRHIWKFIINGEVVQPMYKYPWIVAIRNFWFPERIDCGGAIISATYVLTAGHCIVNREKSIYPVCKGGITSHLCLFKPNEIALNLQGSRPDAKQMPVRVAQIIPYDKFDFNKTLHDIALIKLASPIQCNHLSSPICLPTKDLHKLGGKLIIAGYGYKERRGGDEWNDEELLREGTMMQVEPQVCKRALSRNFHNNLTDIVCAIGTQTNYSTCWGDSGSSIFAKFGNKMYTLGVTSRHSSEECETHKPATYAKVYPYLDWIKKHVKDLPGSQE